MKIACVCITKGNRAPVFGIAAASFAKQTHERKTLFLDFPEGGFGDAKAYVEALERTGAGSATGSFFMTVYGDTDDVPTRLDAVLNDVFEAHGFDLAAIWDDDDYHPPSRLQRSAAIFKAMPDTGVVGYRKGYFCNLRTLQGYAVENDDKAPWGATLMISKEAWRHVKGFKHRSCPGYDRSFVKDVREAGLGVIRIEDSITPPVAFSHDDNIATWLMRPGQNLRRMLERAPAVVLHEIEQAQAWLIERNIYPPQTPK